MAFELPQLPYATDALEPHIDTKTMEIHHGKHHNGYTTKLNDSLVGNELENKSIEEILKNLDMNNTALRNNGGGYFNHCLFWESLSPKDQATARQRPPGFASMMPRKARIAEPPEPPEAPQEEEKTCWYYDR